MLLFTTALHWSLVDCSANKDRGILFLSQSISYISLCPPKNQIKIWKHILKNMQSKESILDDSPILFRVKDLVILWYHWLDVAQTAHLAILDEHVRRRAEWRTPRWLNVTHVFLFVLWPHTRGSNNTTMFCYIIKDNLSTPGSPCGVRDQSRVR